MRRLLIAFILTLIALNFFLYYIDKPADNNKDLYELLLQQKSIDTENMLDEFSVIDQAFTDKNLESKWIYTVKSDSSWFKRIRVPSTYTLSKYNLFFQKILRNNNIELLKAEEYELSNKIVFSFNTTDSIRATVELRVVHDIESELKLSGNISIIIHGLGDTWGEEWLKELLAIPVECTVSIIPGRWATGNLYNEAVKNKKTILINLPMEPEKGNIEKEKYRLMKGMNSFSVDVVLEKSLEEMPLAAGYMNYRGGRVISDYETMDIFLKALRKKNMIYVENYDGMYSYSELIAADYGIPFVFSFVAIEDPEDFEERTDEVLERINEGEDILLLIRATDKNHDKLKKVLSEKFRSIDFISLYQFAGRR